MFDDFTPDDEALDDDDKAEVAAPVTGTLPVPRENPECIGHDDIEAMLLRLSEQGRLPHAMIFAGPKGIGKSTMAYRFARFILDTKEAAEEPGGLFGAPEPAAPVAADTLSIPADSATFRQVASGGHADLLTVERPYDEKKDRRKDILNIDSARKIAPFMRMTASKDGGWRVVIVDDADTMNPEAQNAILKIVEEPPQRALLILVCHRPAALLPTIRSRCRMIAFQPLSQPVFATLVRRLRPNLDTDSIASLHALTGGSIGQAQDLLEEGGLERLASLTVLLAGSPNWKWESIHALADTLARADDQYRMADKLLRWCIDSLVRAAASTAPLPESLKPAKLLMSRYSLPDWIAIRDALFTHLDRTLYSNLDKRQGVIGAFTILSSAP